MEVSGPSAKSISQPGHAHISFCFPRTHIFSPTHLFSFPGSHPHTVLLISPILSLSLTHKENPPNHL